jgi:outer membrane protein OmpA-like peptidoglycan-associated protein
MKKVVIYSALFLLPLLAVSQSTSIVTAFHGNVKKADVYFDHFAYRNALTLYQHALDRDPASVYLRERIAMCYFKLHDPAQAEFWYATIIKDSAIHASAKFEYAESLSMNGKYDYSKFWFEQFLIDRPDDKLATEKVAFLKDVSFYLADSLRFIVNEVTFNSTHSDYGAHYFHEGVVFASSRDVDQFVKHKAFDGVDIDESLLNMYYVKGKKHGDHEKVQHLHKENIKSYLHEGPMAFYQNDTKTAFTRTNIKNGKPVYDEDKRAHLQIFFADVDKLGSMSNMAPYEHSNINYSTAHPTVSQDGKLMYFSSTAPQGLGGSDIYYSRFVNGKWTEPENVGTGINTKGDESFPFLANDSTLYFSSNGHGTLGGLDILVSHKVNGKFRKAINFGGPLNSRYDDFSLVCDSIGRYGYIASNRPGGAGLDDVYYFISSYYWLTGKVVTHDKTGDPIEGAMVYAIDKNTGEVLDSAITNAYGRYDLNLPYDRDYNIVGAKEGYDLLDGQQFTTQGRPMGIDTLNVALWKRDLNAKGRIYSNETQQPLAGVMVTAFNLTDHTQEAFDLKDLSEYSVPLRPDKKYKLEFSKPAYVTAELNINTDGMLRGDLLNDIVMEEESIDKVVIYFEFDKSTITEESIKLMKPLVKVLKRYPSATLNVSGHDDARGSVEYNQRLSDDRARKTAQYFISQGISPKRIEAKGFGELLLLNKCSDGVVCEEPDHSANRRSEIKVQLEK